MKTFVETQSMINHVQPEDTLPQTDSSVLPLVDSVLRERKVYRDATLAGLGVVEMHNSLAKAEIEHFAQEIFGAVGATAATQSKETT